MIAPPKPPQHDEIEALIEEARARQSRRRLIGAASIAVAAAVGLSIYAFTVDGGIDNVAQPSAGAGRAAGPPCRASQLSATAGFQGATQTMLGGVSITNTSATTCSFPSGRPAVQVFWHGAALSVRELPGPRSIGPSFHPAHVLPPGAHAEVIMQWRDRWYCGTGAQKLDFSPRFALHLTGGLLVVATAHGLIEPNCGKPGISYLEVTRPLTDT